MFWDVPERRMHWPSYSSSIYTDGSRKDGGRPHHTSLQADLMQAGPTAVMGQGALLYAALAAIACALKLCKVPPGETVNEDEWPGGCPHCQEGAAVYYMHLTCLSPPQTWTH